MPDYGNGKTNIDPATGIRYGVIHPNDVDPVYFDRCVPVYGEPDRVICPECKHDCREAGQKYGDCLECEDCGNSFEIDYPEEPIGYEINNDEYHTQQRSERDIFITKSPYYTYAPFCSPCAPGAGYLGAAYDSDEMNGVKTYCFGHDFFRDDVAPYKVYGVKTGKEVTPEDFDQ